ncbi:MAG TPA: hypothetical protein VFU81_15130, partial [Thermomicrobiales bacterium]|nr:hypothetical protein [Thermomicrobiales bacterium]
MITTMEPLPRTAFRQATIEDSRRELLARAVADRYLGYVSALWRGDPDGPRFGVWLSQFWRTALPPAPRRPPDAVSLHGAGGRGLWWFEAPDAAIGYVPGTRCGYYVPRAAWGVAPQPGR